MGVLVICVLSLFGYPDWGFSLFFLSCKANAGVKLVETGHGPHSSKLVVICVVLYIVCICAVLCIVCVYICTVLLPPGVNPIAVDKYHIISSYHIISYHIISYHIIYRIIYLRRRHSTVIPTNIKATGICFVQI